MTEENDKEVIVDDGNNELMKHFDESFKRLLYINMYIDDYRVWANGDPQKNSSEKQQLECDLIEGLYKYVRDLMELALANKTKHK